MQVLGTFQSRDAAEAVREALLDDGFKAGDMIVMSNPESQEPPEAAHLEAEGAGEGGLKGVEEKIGRTVLSLLGRERKARLDGDGSEGEGRGGALLAVTVPDETSAALVKALLERHFASDIEMAQPD